MPPNDAAAQRHLYLIGCREPAHEIERPSGMIILPPPQPKHCLYCGAVYKKPKRGKGEHIVPEAIDGNLTLDEISESRVCQDCNNGVLSLIDKELCGRSHLSVVASQEIDSHLWQIWDVDHSAGNVLVEASPKWDKAVLNSLVCYPQIHFEHDGPKIRGDMEDMHSIGEENYDNVLVRAAVGAYQRYNHHKKHGLHLERVDTRMATENYRYPPRVFSVHPVKKIAEEIDQHSFTLRFVNESDKRRALLQLGSLSAVTFERRGRVMGSRMPAIATFYDPGICVRALMKIGLNLIAAYCKKTPVNQDTFRRVIRMITGEVHPRPELIASNGFVCDHGIEDIKAPKGAHAFRLIHMQNEWCVYLSFFGGRINAVVSFPGPNNEDWKSLDIIAPLGSKEWTHRESRLIKMAKVQIEWQEIQRIAPTVLIQNAKSTLTVELAPPKQKKAKRQNAK